jgi:hypothetical protein
VLGHLVGPSVTRCGTENTLGTAAARGEKAAGLRGEAMPRIALAVAIAAALVCPALAQEWKIVGEIGLDGMTKFVYVEPEGLNDKDFMAQVLLAIENKSTNHRAALNVSFFDDLRYTPAAFPMTNKQMLHWKARYTNNPNSGVKEFVRIKITDAKADPPRFTEEKTKIVPGYAE